MRIPWTYHCLLLTFLFCAPKLQGKVHMVCPDCPISSIKQAVQLAKDGDEIHVQAGTYFESNLLIDKSITIKGIKRPVIDGQGEGEIFIVAANKVTLQGMAIRNSGRSHIKDLAAIRIKKKKDFVIRDNIITKSFFAIYIEQGQKGIIEENVILGQAKNEMSSGNAIHCWYAKGLLIRNNTIKKHRDGIYFEFVDNSHIIGNLSENNIRYGLHFMFSNDDSYTQNTFRSNGAGVAVMFSKRISMTENKFLKNWGASSYGLLLKEIYDAEILHNEFFQNTIGILLEGSTRIKYSQNSFKQNGWAIQMNGGCLDNTFTKNNFISNSLDLVVNSRINNNSFDGNYWSDYSGYDLDRNGSGDIPHRPVKLYSYVLAQSPESIILLRSFFIDLLNFSEKVSPVFTPENIFDNTPLMQPVL